MLGGKAPKNIGNLGLRAMAREPVRNLVSDAEQTKGLRGRSDSHVQTVVLGELGKWQRWLGAPLILHRRREKNRLL